MSRAARREDKIHIKLSGRAFKKHMAILRKFADCSYDSSSKDWIMPYSRSALARLQKIGIELDQGIRDDLYRDSFVIEQKAKKEVFIDRKPFENLFDCQFEGLKFMESTGGRCILSWDTGVGKTVGALSYLNLHNNEIKKVLIIVPATVKYQWEDEYNRWVWNKSEVQIIQGQSLQRIKCPVVIINYDVLQYHINTLMENRFDLLIADEIQMIKTIYSTKKKKKKDGSPGRGYEKTKRYEAFKLIADTIPKILALSATPVTRRPAEFFAILNILLPKVFSNHYAYLQKFCDPTHNGFGFQYNGMSNEKELTALLDTVMDRQEKMTHGLIRTPIYLDIDNKEEYNALEHKKDSVARYTAYEGKKKGFFEFLDSLLENEKVTVFGYHKKVIEDIAQHYKGRCIIINGDTPVRERRRLVRDFNIDPAIRLAVCNNQAAGTGLDGLQRNCSVGVFVQMPWTAAERTQIEGRLERTGQSKMVNFYYVIGKGTVDESDINRIEDYMVMFNTLINQRDTEEKEYLEK